MRFELKKQKNIPLILIFFVVFIDLLGFGLLIPILPTFAVNVLKVEETAIGAVIAVYSFVTFIFNPIIGSLSDKYGRRPVILITLLINAIGYVVLAFSNTFLILVISRVISGIGASTLGVSQAYIADVTTPENRAKGMGLIGVAFGLGMVFGPFIGGVLSPYGFMVIGFSSAGFSFIAFFISIFFLPESYKPEAVLERARKIIDLPGIKKVFENKAIAVLTIMFFVIVFSFANIYGTLSLLAFDLYKMTDPEISLLFGVMGAIYVIVQGGLIGKLTKIFSDQALISYATILMVAALIALPFGETVSYVYIVVILLSIGASLIQPVIMGGISKFSASTQQGSVLGISQSFGSLGRVLGPLWGGFAYEFLGYEMPFLTGAFFTFFIIIFAIFFLGKYYQTQEIS